MKPGADCGAMTRANGVDGGGGVGLEEVLEAGASAAPPPVSTTGIEEADGEGDGAGEGFPNGGAGDAAGAAPAAPPSNVCGSGGGGLGAGDAPLPATSRLLEDAGLVSRDTTDGWKNIPAARSVVSNGTLASRSPVIRSAQTNRTQRVRSEA